MNVEELRKEVKTIVEEKFRGNIETAARNAILPDFVLKNFIEGTLREPYGRDGGRLESFVMRNTEEK